MRFTQFTEQDSHNSTHLECMRHTCVLFATVKYANMYMYMGNYIVTQLHSQKLLYVIAVTIITYLKAIPYSL